MFGMLAIFSCWQYYYYHLHQKKNVCSILCSPDWLMFFAQTLAWIGFYHLRLWTFSWGVKERMCVVWRKREEEFKRCDGTSRLQWPMTPISTPPTPISTRRTSPSFLQPVLATGNLQKMTVPGLYLTDYGFKSTACSLTAVGRKT